MPRLDPRVAAVRSAVARALPGQDAQALVACSGGPDSTALAAGAAFHVARGARVGAVVVDHGLQPGSDTVAAAAARVCRDLGLDPVRVVAVQVDGRANVEARARAARRAALEGVARDLDAPVVLLGHTLDDQAETVLLGLARGSGPRSIAGMAPTAGLWRRPLLHLRRDDVAAAAAVMLAAAGLDYRPWTDPHNTDDAFARVRVRHTVLPQLEASLGPGIAPALARTATRLREDTELLDALAAELTDRAGTPQSGYDVAVLAEAHPALRGRAVHRAVLAAGCPPAAVTEGHVAEVAALITHWHGQGPVHLPGGRRASRSYGRLALTAHDDSRRTGDTR